VFGKIAIAAGVAGSGYLAYHCYSPTSQQYGATIHTCPDPQCVALTYDDGPNDAYTEQLLSVLEQHHVKATFFLIGKFVAMRPQLVRSIAAGGHLLANHTYTHPNLLLSSSSQIRKQLADCSTAIADAAGVKPSFFRPPFGARRPAVLEIARELGLEPVMWDVTCYDWRRTSADRVEQHANRGIEQRGRGHIVLLHDGSHTKMGADRSHTIEATRRLLLRYAGSRSFRRIDQI